MDEGQDCQIQGSVNSKRNQGLAMIRRFQELESALDKSCFANNESLLLAKIFKSAVHFATPESDLKSSTSEPISRSSSLSMHVHLPFPLISVETSYRSGDGNRIFQVLMAWESEAVEPLSFLKGISWCTFERPWFYEEDIWFMQKSLWNANGGVIREVRADLGLDGNQSPPSDHSLDTMSDFLDRLYSSKRSRRPVLIAGPDGPEPGAPTSHEGVISRSMEISRFSPERQPIRYGGTHASPMLHLRRGHERIISQERKVWVKSSIVGNPDRGLIDKDYRLTES